MSNSYLDSMYPKSKKSGGFWSGFFDLFGFGAAIESARTEKEIEEVMKKRNSIPAMDRAMLFLDASHRKAINEGLYPKKVMDDYNQRDRP